MQATCITTRPFYYAIVSDIVAEIFLLVMPTPLLLRLKQPTRVTVTLIAMFSMGILLVACRPYIPELVPIQCSVTMAALYFISTLHHTLDGMSLPSPLVRAHADERYLLTGDVGFSWMVAMLKHSVGAASTCMPGVFVFFRWVRGDVLESGAGGKPVYQNGGDRSIGTSRRWVAEEFELSGAMYSTEELVDAPMEAV